ncbi:MAG: glycoside hydrolase family 3 N-terminal domain-containing protein [Acidobacteriota bacterium]
MNPAPLFVTPDGWAPGRGLEGFLREVRPHGVLLFARHLKSASQVRELCACVRQVLPGTPPRIALDQEGGRVSRLSALGARYPGASDMAGDARRVEALAFEMGEHLRDLGFTDDFAPVADLGPALPGTGLEGRVYGEDPGVVTACCRAFLKGLERAGVRGCLKHYPGLGGSLVDSHVELPLLQGGPDDRRDHFEPYRRLAAEAPSVMVAHASAECYGDPSPTSLNREVYAELRSMGVKGILLTDDLAMGALDGMGSLSVRLETCLGAGADAAIVVYPQEEVLRALASASRSQAFAEASSRLAEVSKRLKP